MNESTMSPEERAVLTVLNIRINDLMYSRPQVLVRPIASWEPVPPYLLTPQVIRMLVQRECRDLERAKQIEEHVVARIKVGGVPFLKWEADPTVLKDVVAA
jgi:hypothetical protein